ncbi:hypothetical protein [Simiduia agarivorans]|nr:hypothetical protein [Simiduia agarivorans]
MKKTAQSSANTLKLIALGVVCGLGTATALADDAGQTNVDALERQLLEERARLDALEAQLNALRNGNEHGDRPSAPAAVETPRQLIAAEGRGDPYADAAFNKSTPLFGSPWRFSFGGYAKTDVIHDFSGTGSKRQFVLGQIPVDNNPPEGSYSHIQVNETRFHFESRNTESEYENSVFLEFDFFDESTPSNLRLRHAYARYGKLLVGQTWTLLSELRQLPLMIDFAAGDSILGGRTQQIRWTEHSKDKSLGWAIALEKFNDAAIYNPFNLPGEARADFPRVATGVTKLWDQFEWSNGVAVTQVRFDGPVGDSALAVTATSAGRVYLNEAKNNWFGFGVGYVNGSIDDVITYGNAGVPNAVIDADGKLELAKGWNTQLGLHMTWSSTLSSNFSYAHADLTDVPDGFEADWIRKGSAFHANLMYRFDSQLTVGVEVMTGVRENVSGRDGDAQRIQFSTFYYF